MDYFAAEDARAFDDLFVIVRQISCPAPSKEWEMRIAQGLKSDKSYLKGDFKVFTS